MIYVHSITYCKPYYVWLFNVCLDKTRKILE